MNLFVKLSSQHPYWQERLQAGAKFQKTSGVRLPLKKLSRGRGLEETFNRILGRRQGLSRNAKLGLGFAGAGTLGLGGVAAGMAGQGAVQGIDGYIRDAVNLGMEGVRPMMQGASSASGAASAGDASRSTAANIGASNPGPWPGDLQFLGGDGNSPEFAGSGLDYMNSLLNKGGMGPLREPSTPIQASAPSAGGLGAGGVKKLIERGEAAFKDLGQPGWDPRSYDRETLKNNPIGYWGSNAIRRGKELFQGEVDKGRWMP